MKLVFATLILLHCGHTLAVDPKCPQTLRTALTQTDASEVAPIEIRTDRLVLRLEERNWTLWDLRGKQIGRILALSESPIAEFGIVVTQRSQGYATEALYSLMRYYIEQKGAREVIARVKEYNIPSLRLHKKLGFRLIKHQNKNATLAITAEEFQQISKHVESLPAGTFFRNAAPETGNPYFP